MASGHVYRANRPNTWPLRPTPQSEDFSFRCRLRSAGDGFQEGGIWPIVGGAIVGSVCYAFADWLVSRNGAHHRKQSGAEQQSAAEGGGLAIAIGSLLDGIPESIVLGLGLLTGQGVSLAMFAAIFLSNLPEGFMTLPEFE